MLTIENLSVRVAGRLLIDDASVRVPAGSRTGLVGRNGTTVVLKKSNGLEILATNSLDERFDASPALAGRDLYLRGHEHLYCLAETGGRQ